MNVHDSKKPNAKNPKKIDFFYIQLFLRMNYT